MTVGEQRIYQQQQIKLQKEQMAVQKEMNAKQMEISEAQLQQAKNSVIEPVKSAETAMSGAADSATRAAQLRRGIASTFSRGIMGRQKTASGSSTGGTAAKLGG